MDWADINLKLSIDTQLNWSGITVWRDLSSKVVV